MTMGWTFMIVGGLISVGGLLAIIWHFNRRAKKQHREAVAASLREACCERVLRTRERSDEVLTGSRLALSRAEKRAGVYT